MSDKVSMKKKIEAVVNLLKALNKVTKNKFDLHKEREENGFNRGYLVEVVLADLDNLPVFGWADDEALKFRLKQPEDRKVDVVVVTTSDTIMNAIDGRIKVMDQRTGKERFAPYGFAEAVNLGHIKGSGPQFIAMSSKLMRVWDEYIERIRPELNKIRKIGGG